MPQASDTIIAVSKGMDKLQFIMEYAAADEHMNLLLVSEEPCLLKSKPYLCFSSVCLEKVITQTSENVLWYNSLEVD